MYQFVCRWLLLCCLTSLFLSVNAKGKSDYSKTIIKEFPLEQGGLLEVDHRHGDLQIVDWSEQAVRFEVRIIVNTKDENKAKKMFEYLSCEFFNSNDLVKASTKINKNLYKLSKHQSFTIDLLIYRPTNSKTSITNSHGDVFIKNMEQPLYVSVKHGDLKIGLLKAPAEIHMGYGHCKIESATELLSSVKYGKLKVGSVNDLKLESRHSKVYIDDVNNFDCQSKYDNYYLGDVGKLRNQGKHDNFKIESVVDIQLISRYSDFIIHQLGSSGQFEVAYSDVRINGVQRGLKRIFGDGRHSDFVIKSEGVPNFSLSTMGQHSTVKTPASFKVHTKVSENHEIQIKGHKGSAGGAKFLMDLVHSSCKIIE